VIKYHGRHNLGFAKANRNRTRRAIAKAYRDGRRPTTDLALARMMDRVYGTTYEERFHKETP
jgi:hypothetical protein